VPGSAHPSRTAQHELHVVDLVEDVHQRVHGQLHPVSRRRQGVECFEGERSRFLFLVVVTDPRKMRRRWRWRGRRGGVETAILGLKRFGYKGEG
jgi:hypothetical protein